MLQQFIFETSIRFQRSHVSEENSPILDEQISRCETQFHTGETMAHRELQMYNEYE